MENESALVSILVLAYNAQEYVIDMLNSIREQTYERLELVIADNGSIDLTQTYISDWLKNNSYRFERTIFHKNKVNIALTKNINLGLTLCRGKYIKFAYAYDMLVPDCIEKNYNMCEENSWEVVFSNVKYMGTNKLVHWRNREIQFYKLSAAEQYKRLAVKNIILAPTFFCRKSVLNRMGGYDEEYKYLDDYPMWIKMTSHGIKLNYFDDITVLYRIHEGSLSYEGANDRIVNILFFASDRKLFFKERLRLLYKHGFYKEIIFQSLQYVYISILIYNGNVWNRRNQAVRKEYEKICSSLHKYLY